MFSKGLLFYTGSRIWGPYSQTGIAFWKEVHHSIALRALKSGFSYYGFRPPTVDDINPSLPIVRNIP